MSKVFLSIGSGPGIGLATAQRFAREGFDVVLAARNTERLQPCADEIVITGGRAVVRRVDASDPAAVAELVQSAGPDLHTLHYNAGVLHYDTAGKLTTRTLDDESVASLASDTAINIAGALAAVHAAAPVMSARGSGTVLLTGGGLGVQPSGDFLTLSVGKAGLQAIGQALPRRPLVMKPPCSKRLDSTRRAGPSSLFTGPSAMRRAPGPQAAKGGRHPMPPR